MHYRLHATPSGGVVLNRSSLRFLFFFVFLVLSVASIALGRTIRLGLFSLGKNDALSCYALGLILASASFIVLMNKGSPNKIVIDGDGLILIHPGKNLRIWKEDIMGVRAVETMSLPPDLDREQRLAAKRIEIVLSIGSTLPIYEGANDKKIEMMVERCQAALETGPSARGVDFKGRPEDSLFEIKFSGRGIIRKEGDSVSIRAPNKIDLPGFLMGSGMQAGFGIFLFGSLPGKIDKTILIISIGIWGLIAVSLVFAFFFNLFGRQRLVIGPKEIESRRRFFGLPFPSRGLKRSEAASVMLDVETGQLSVISKELKRITADSPDGLPVGERMGELLGGKAVKLDLSSLVWGERIALQKAVAAILAEPAAKSDETPLRPSSPF